MGVRSARALLAIVFLVAAPGLTACSSTSPYPAANDPSWLRSQEQALLDQRAAAIRHHDLKAFLQGVARGDKAFVARQRRYFANLVQLPLEQFGYRVESATWPEQLAAPSWGADVQLPRVQETIELAGYDDAPARSVTGFAFAYHAGVLKIVSDVTRTGAQFPGYHVQPWDLTAVTVHHLGGVLGLFDKGTDPDAASLLSVVAAGVHDVEESVPFAWSGRVVVYSFGNQAVLNSYVDVPGGDIRHLGALSFPIYADDSDKQVVAMRFTLLPSSLEAGEPFLGRIVRHELTHVAVGTRDDGVPVWFAEGLAEYVGARPLPRDQRRIASVALSMARGAVDSMPASASFNGPDQDWHYALSWMACDYIAATQGESMLWTLMDALHNGGIGTPDDKQDAVLDRVLGYDSHELARRAAARILSIYG